MPDTAPIQKGETLQHLLARFVSTLQNHLDRESGVSLKLRTREWEEDVSGDLKHALGDIANTIFTNYNCAPPELWDFITKGLPESSAVRAASRAALVQQAIAATCKVEEMHQEQVARDAELRRASRV